MRLPRLILLGIIILINFNYSFSQNESIDTLIVLGKIKVDTSQISISKMDFLKSGKIKTNLKGLSVNSYKFSMFALGNSIKCAVNDSMLTTKLREAVLNKGVNYRYINIEGVTLIDRSGKISSPKVDTVKVKFKYQ